MYWAIQIQSIQSVQDIITSYNNSYHRSIKRKPVEVNKQNEKDVFTTLYKNLKSVSGKPKFKLGDQVRITKSKELFKKSDTPSWTEEIFTVSRILRTNPYTYVLKDYNGEELLGAFYKFELQKVKAKTVFKIEKVLAERKVAGAENEVLVRWLGYRSSFDSWLPKSYVTDYR